MPQVPLGRWPSAYARCRRAGALGALWLPLALIPAACQDPTGVPRSVRDPLEVGTRPARGLPAAFARPAEAADAYAEYCARCHGEAGAGDGFLAGTLDPKPSDLRSLPPKVTPRRAYRAIERGVTGSSMKRFDHVLDAQARWDMAFLVWSMSQPSVDIARGAEAFADRCAGCHGVPGRPGRFRLDDPARADQTPAEVRRLLRKRHAADGVLDADPDATLDAALVAYLYTFLYEPPVAGVPSLATDVSTPAETH